MPGALPCHFRIAKYTLRMTENGNRRCRHCNGPMPPQRRGRGRPRLYCTPACTIAADRARKARRMLLGAIIERRTEAA